ncbi:MAG TPA: hypothetical protein PLO37_13050 [Candidatus Hydrogenedentes bacterium]|nr:hypothetical protein [Candidatus Hydrogenedentota bacterium]HPG67770.1 hypothetical protein [Candidatus Hydrogenedentota bacterium]
MADQKVGTVKAPEIHNGKVVKGCECPDCKTVFPPEPGMPCMLRMCPKCQLPLQPKY